MTISLLPFAWMDDALCAQIGPDLWFHSNGDTAAARRLCSGCPVKSECAQHAADLERGQDVNYRCGTWGGLTARDRARVDTVVHGNPERDERIVWLSRQKWDAVRIAYDVGCDERTVYRVLKRVRGAS